MLDIKFIREHQDELKDAIKNKGIGLNLDELLDADKARVALLQEVEELREKKNKLNDQVSGAKSDEERKAAIAKGKDVKDKLSEIEPKLSEANRKFEELMIMVPTIPSPDTPIGKSDADNKDIFHWGEPKKFDFAPKDHMELGRSRHSGFRQRHESRRIPRILCEERRRSPGDGHNDVCSAEDG